MVLKIILPAVWICRIVIFPEFSVPRFAQFGSPSILFLNSCDTPAYIEFNRPCVFVLPQPGKSPECLDDSYLSAGGTARSAHRYTNLVSHMSHYDWVLGRERRMEIEMQVHEVPYCRLYQADMIRLIVELEKVGTYGERIKHLTPTGTKPHMPCKGIHCH